MDKQSFLEKFKNSLAGLPEEDIRERLEFYGEMIDDRMEDGVSEEEAVAGIGSIDKLVAQTVEEIPLAKIVKEKMGKQRKFKTWEIVCLALGSPVWASLLIAAAAVLLTLYASLWVVIIVLWAVAVTLAVCGVGCAVAGFVFAFRGTVMPGIATIGAGFMSAGLSGFLFRGCEIVTKGAVLLTKKEILHIKNAFIRKEERK